MDHRNKQRVENPKEPSDAPPTGQTDEDLNRPASENGGSWSGRVIGPDPTAVTDLPRVGDSADIAAIEDVAGRSKQRRGA
jgi:hypothetical protein